MDAGKDNIRDGEGDLSLSNDEANDIETKSKTL
jgi:hypothetical protein